MVANRMWPDRTARHQVVRMAQRRARRGSKLHVQIVRRRGVKNVPTQDRPKTARLLSSVAILATDGIAQNLN